MQCNGSVLASQQCTKNSACVFKPEVFGVKLTNKLNFSSTGPVEELSNPIWFYWLLECKDLLKMGVDRLCNTKYRNFSKLVALDARGHFLWSRFGFMY